MIKQKLKEFLLNRVRNGYWFNEEIFPDCKKFWDHKEFNLDVANIGSTSGMNAFCYEKIPLKCANWALRKNPIMVDFEVLKNYYSYLKVDGAVLIIPLCPFTSLSGGYDNFDDRLYSILKMASFPHFSLNRRDEMQDIKNHPLRYYPLRALLSDFRNKKEKNVRKTDEWMRNDAENWMNGWMKEFCIQDFSCPLSMRNMDGIEDAARIINEMLSFCKDHGIRPVILIPPVYHTLGDKFTPNIRKIVIESLLDKITAKTVWYHNYMDDSEFTNDITLYRNSFVLNEKGARLFTKRVLTDIGLL